MALQYFFKLYFIDTLRHKVESLFRLFMRKGGQFHGVPTNVVLRFENNVYKIPTLIIQKLVHSS